jgi:hypothetical protein
MAWNSSPEADLNLPRNPKMCCSIAVVVFVYPKLMCMSYPSTNSNIVYMIRSPNLRECLS